MYSGIDIAAYVVKRCHELKSAVSNLKLQKLLYFIQAYFLMVDGKPCFEDKIEAWSFGPVVPSVYQVYKYYCAGSIPYFGDEKIGNISYPDRQKIDAIINVFSGRSANELVEITHRQSPWREAYVPYQNNEITIQSIREYFDGIRNAASN